LFFFKIEFDKKNNIYYCIMSSNTRRNQTINSKKDPTKPKKTITIYNCFIKLVDRSLNFSEKAGQWKLWKDGIPIQTVGGVPIILPVLQAMVDSDKIRYRTEMAEWIPMSESAITAYYASRPQGSRPQGSRRRTSNPSTAQPAARVRAEQERVKAERRAEKARVKALNIRAKAERRAEKARVKALNIRARAQRREAVHQRTNQAAHQAARERTQRREEVAARQMANQRAAARQRARQREELRHVNDAINMITELNNSINYTNYIGYSNTTQAVPLHPNVTTRTPAVNRSSNGRHVRSDLSNVVEDNSTIAEEGAPTCVVCMTNTPTIAGKGCGHMCLCAGCSNTLALDSSRCKCPICRVKWVPLKIFV
jgi:hypothetical protein